MPLFPVIGQISTGAKHVAVLGGLFPDAGSIPAASTIFYYYLLMIYVVIHFPLSPFCHQMKHF